MERKKCEMLAIISALNTCLVVPDFWELDFSAYLLCQWMRTWAVLVHFLCELRIKE